MKSRSREVKKSRSQQMDPLERVKFDAQGLAPAVIQDARSRKVLTLCYMNREAFERTLKEGKVYVYRRSQGRVMLKGETSRHIQLVKAVYLDCEGHSVLFEVEQRVAACHAGYFTCYYRRLDKQGGLQIVEQQVFDPKNVYTS